MRIFEYVATKLWWLAIVLGLALAIIGGIYSARLYINLRPSIEELLPTDARSLTDLNKARDRIKSIDSLAVLVFSRNVSASRRFVDTLVAKLQGAPNGLVSGVEYQIKDALQFFDKRKALYAELDDLIKVRNYIEQRIEYEKELYNPLNIFTEKEIPEPTLDFEDLLRKYSGRVTSYTRFPDGYYATLDQTKRVILIYPTASASEIDQMKRFTEFVRTTIDNLDPASYSEDLEIHYTGNVQNIIEEQSTILNDIKSSAMAVSILTVSSMLIFFGSIRATLAILTTITFAVAWTIGSAYFSVGQLNSNSAFLGSIIIGNGINYSIIVTSRYLELLRKHYSVNDAIKISLRFSASPTAAASLAAAASYGSLMLTGFRGFRQFGLIGLTGMLLSWLAAFTVLPAFFKLFSITKTKEKRKVEILPALLAKLINHHKNAILFISALAFIVALASLPKFNSDILEGDLSKVRSKESLTKGSGFYSKYVDEIFQKSLSPIAILPEAETGALIISKSLKNRKSGTENSLLASIQTIEDFIPGNQEQKIEVLKEIEELLPATIRTKLSPADRQQIETFLRPEVFHPVSITDLPKVILDRFTETDGSVGKMVVVEPPLGDQIRQRENLFSFIDEIRSVTDQVAPGTPVVGQLVITADILKSISTDGPRATFFALTAVISVVVLLFRSARTSFFVLTNLILGIFWLVGLILWLDIKINFLNFVIIPLTFGIGVDYGMNIFQRYQQEGRGSALEVVKSTGSAVGLSAWTTIIGYGSLLFAVNQAFFSFGLLAVLGELTCTIASLLTIPALLAFIDRKRKTDDYSASRAA